MSSGDETPATPSPNEETAGGDYQLPESEVHFAFGPDKYYWVRCGTKWRFIRLDKGDFGFYEIESPYWVAFKHDTGLLIGGVNEDGESEVTHSWIEGYLIQAKDVDSYIKSRDAYSKLRTWIYDHVKSDAEKVKRVAISIGPKGSYFARSGSSHITHALPKDLETSIKESNSPPIIVALGARGAWVVLWADGTRSWHLRDAYPSLATSGYLGGDSRIVFIALDPYIENNHFLVLEDGQCSYNATKDQEELYQLHQMTDSYMQSRAKRDGSSFSQTWIRNGVAKNYRITPDSIEQEGRGKALVAMLRGRQNILRNNDVAFCGALGAGAGIIAKVAGAPTLKAVGMAAWVSIGAGLNTWFRGT